MKCCESFYWKLLSVVLYFTSDKGRGICNCPWCLSVSLFLYARLLKNAHMD